MTFRNIEVATYGENYAVSVLMSFSKVCLLLAKHKRSEVKEENLLKNVLSVTERFKIKTKGSPVDMRF